MSLEQKSLLKEIESYLRGEHPPAEMLAAAPRLDGWAVKIGRGPDTHEMTLVGRPTGHPDLVDGHDAHTSPIIWLDRSGRWARSQNRLWRLGEPECTELQLEGVDA